MVTALSKLLSIRRNQLAIVAVTFIAVHCICFVIYAGRPLQDAEHYIEAGKLLLNEGRIDEYFHSFYFIPIALLAVFASLFGDPQPAYILFQTLLSGLSVFFLYRLVEDISSSRAAFFASMLFVLWVDNVRWDVLVMTESLFGSTIIFVLFALTHFRKDSRSIIMPVVLLFVAVFTRPTGVLACIALAAFFIHLHADRIAASRYSMLAIGLFVVGLLSWAALELSRTWDFTDQYFRGNVITYADTWAGDKRLMQFDPGPIGETTTVSSPIVKAISFVWHHPLHVLFVSALKLFYLLSGVRPYYSMSHNIMTIVWMGVVYFGVLRGLRAMKTSPFKTVLITFIAGNCLLVAATTADWDNRFYIPMEAAVVVLAGIGWDRRIEN